ncbi:hypothetical protein [Thiomonas delicata]|uniref:Uncharacterized protein n=1 Tax=Thiomonas delicata TaxID=364030 RepID=A0A238D7H6_THIDL|nr:hypothetical protein [Thiomonas delicata]SBP89266.1 hypothetical protein THIARS_70886 [Thiomonas delicata]
MSEAIHNTPVRQAQSAAQTIQGAAPNPGASNPAVEQDKVHDARQRFASITGLHLIDSDVSTGFAAYGDGIKRLAIFGGKRTKADRYNTYSTWEKALETAARVKAAAAKQLADKATAREAEAAKPCPLKVGDVLVASWGYEQTNIDFYQVTTRTGKRGVTLRKITSQRETDAWEQGTCVPAVGHFVGEPFTARSNSRGTVTLASYKTAYPCEYTEVAGVRLYKPTRWTSYY